MKNRLNFAPEPFKSHERALILMWALNILLFLAILFLIWQWRGLVDQNHSAHNQINGLKEKQQEIADANQDAINQLESIDMKLYRKQVTQFHQVQQAFQTHWGKLLDQLAEILPEDVRLTELKPTTSREKGPLETKLSLVAQARNKEAQLQFIQTLQEDPSFKDITFESENYKEAGIALEFEISFVYHSGRK